MISADVTVVASFLKTVEETMAYLRWGSGIRSLKLQALDSMPTAVRRASVCFCAKAIHCNFLTKWRVSKRNKQAECRL